MTRIAVVSASAAVKRTLEAIILAGGHQLVPAAEAELILQDHLHPHPLPDHPTRILALAARAQNTADTLACPFRPAQLQRLLASQPAHSPIQIGGGWALDLLARNLTHEAAPTVAFTEKECLLLKTLAMSHPHALGREALLEQVWGLGRGIDTHTLETHIYRLRSKLSALTPTAGDIVTVASAYKLVMQIPV
jgi:DNA-binding response OmpR family regulator